VPRKKKIRTKEKIFEKRRSSASVLRDTGTSSVKSKWQGAHSHIKTEECATVATNSGTMMLPQMTLMATGPMIVSQVTALSEFLKTGVLLLTKKSAFVLLAFRELSVKLAETKYVRFRAKIEGSAAMSDSLTHNHVTAPRALKEYFVSCLFAL
jgi:hypothetical protein